MMRKDVGWVEGPQSILPTKELLEARCGRQPRIGPQILHSEQNPKVEPPATFLVAGRF